MEGCSEHKLHEARMNQHERDYKELVVMIKDLQGSFESGLCNLDEKIEVIYKRLVGDLDAGTVGWVTKINSLEAAYSSLKDTKITLQRMMPWFVAFKWTFLVVAPVILLGTLSLVVGLITGSIKIVM